MSNGRNESGNKIKKTDKQIDVYKRWQKSTHLKIPMAGDQEDKKMMGQARSASESRGLVKNFKSRHSDLNKGEDMRDNRKLMQQKGQKMMNKAKQDKSGGSFKKFNKDGSRAYSPKT